MMNAKLKWALIAGVVSFTPMHAVMASDTVDQKATAQADAVDAVKTHPADNTARNARDRNDATTLPTDQPNNQADLDVAAAVRSAIVGDDSLSMAAHNIKLVAANGLVVLRGPVDSAAEKTKISEIVKGVAGVTSVNNQLEIKTP